MGNYNYKAGKNRIKEILDYELKVIENNKIPKDENFTFTNSYYGWVTGLFVDIRDSTSLFTKEDKIIVSKIIRTFASEVIEILRDDDNLRDIGIRGDCVYAIYTSPTNPCELEIVTKAFYINTFIKMLNKLLNEKKFPNISVGIGISTGLELVVKTGRKGVGINKTVWIGDAVTKAANLSSLGAKNGLKQIVMSYQTYTSMIEGLKARNNEQDVESWFNEHYSEENGIYYDADIIRKEFDNWIDSGMND